MNLFTRQLKLNKGFSLLELVVAAAIGSMMIGWALPVYRKLAWQGEVDRYTQMVESGLFNLRSNLGVHRSNCCINFLADSTTAQGLGIHNFGKPNELLELFDKTTSNNLVFIDDTTQDCNGHRIKCLPDDDFTKDYRLIHLENSRESKAVEVATLTGSYILSPPGTSTSGDDLTILIRSSRDKTATAGLRVRCVLLTGNSDLSQGSWNEVGNPNRSACPYDPEDSESSYWNTSKCFCSAKQ